MLDFAAVNTLKLRFPNDERGDLALGPGVHAVGHDEAGRPCLVDQPQDARLQLSIDRRGIWLQLREHAHGLHVNGRPVRRMAMLRAGDTLHMDGMDMVLVGSRPGPVPFGQVADPVPRRMVLRALGGPHHGRCFDLDRPCTVGSSAEAGLCIVDADMPAQHSRLEPHADGVALTGLSAAGAATVNGHLVEDCLLLPGDQIVFGSSHRFVLESPQVASVAVAEAVIPMAADTPRPPAPRQSPLMASLRRIPWLLLAALLLAGVLALLLLYGAR